MSTSTKITRGDIEQKLRKLQGDVEEKIVSQRQKIIAAAAAGAALTLLMAYLLGRRSGRKKNAVVEIRRF